MQRTATALVLAVGLVVVALGCTSDDDGPESLAASPSASPSLSATSTPAWVRPTAEPTPTSAPLVEGDAGLTWESYDVDAGEDPGWFLFATRLFDRETDQFWRLRGEGGRAFLLSMTTEHDVALGIAVGSAGQTVGPTVLVDLATGRIRALTPYAVNPRSWAGFESLDAGTILVEIDSRAGPRDDALPPGTYEVDLGAGEIRRLPAPAVGQQGAVVPEGSSLGDGSLSLRTLGSDGRTAFVLRQADGTERVLLEDVATIWWNPAETMALLEQWNDRQDEQSFILFNAMSGASRDVEVGNYVGGPRWSSDSRYFAMSSGGGEAAIYEPDDRLGTDPLVPKLGPFDGSVFADWGSGVPPAEALLLVDYCGGEDGFNLERIDLATGERRPVPASVGGFWVSDWSPDGAVIAVSSPHLERGFALIDADTGDDVTPPVLAAAIDGMQDVQWSGSGRWLAAATIGGRDRCLDG